MGWKRDRPAEKEYVFWPLFTKGLFAEHAWGAFKKSFFDWGGSKLSEPTQKYVTGSHDKNLVEFFEC